MSFQRAEPRSSMYRVRTEHVLSMYQVCLKCFGRHVGDPQHGGAGDFG